MSDARLPARPDAADGGFATLQVQAGYTPGIAQNTAIPPIYQSNAYEFPSLAHARDVFALRTVGNVYSRNANPTQLVLEERVARLEGGTAAVAVGSGQAASAGAILALASQGHHIVAARQLYGGTIDLLADSLADLGIEVTFVDQDDVEGWRAAARPETRAFFAETITNPLATVLDVRAIADAAHEAGVPLIVDNTVATPYLLRPGDHGADIVVHSATKYLGGHGAALGGVIVDIGRFDFAADPDRWPQFTRPYPRFRDLVLWERFGAAGQALTVYIKTKFVHDFGPTLAATSSSQLLQGIETLDLRMRRHSDNALEVARVLDAHPSVSRVHHPGLSHNPWHGAAARYLPRGTSGVFAFDLAGSGDATRDQQLVERVVDALRVIRLVANIGDARSMVSHPASMTHSHMTPDQLAAAGISPTTIRLSIGLEDPADLTADLAQALSRA
ncbi:MAG: O-acetylhomoserine aminocarboxypropyltransferase [Microbacterium sp.]|uniref:O-acetylhomoserine aminocarboxypropyltransferase/cysteine synthase family protein n=1 Tax=unclassified Microbacterium TaxID=2609290 RepID=UPI000DB0D22C|nr:aminotransferase class I/II-fold pyridoxal phosphate-dependent enzyme [Microbacterium sp.]PZU39648.1 MAG: O-acetylhomoserine aminocarboxypropyltransferase [Microbacterium sp.]